MVFRGLQIYWASLGYLISFASFQAVPGGLKGPSKVSQGGS